MQKAVLSKVGDYTIRLCTTDDIPAVININLLTLPEHYSDYFYYEILSENPGSFIVAELNGVVVGYIMCRTEYGLSQLKRFGLAKKGHVISIATLPDHRGKGIGGRLIEHAHEDMKKTSCRECYLEVRVSNKGAVALYERLGYKIVGNLQNYYRDGESAYMMATTV